MNNPCRTGQRTREAIRPNKYSGTKNLVNFFLSFIPVWKFNDGEESFLKDSSS